MNLLLLMSFLSMLLIHQQETGVQQEKYDARIETTMQDGKLKISNVFENNSPEEVSFTYKFQCKRKGRSGTSVSSQSGKFTAAPGQTVTLSRSAVSVSPSDNYSLTLDVFENGKPVATANYSAGEE
ncbi:curli-like amyloid fiber formation chaperone CsgH [Pontibacter burrus]|uniref:CsgH-like domain-containing protein n=1 Tax=Pontibacter burrus TaxID=2704466 RepID=A0A6B3LUA3_9BACT|nr:curli-like amyloid fiber formation chaperone CsgH [Pontibacter burrus]NEM97061.1 hypothetical protein [Pontibacter burrus]